MSRALPAVRAILLQFETIWGIATILLCDVVTPLAHLACEGDLWANVLRLTCHGFPHLRCLVDSKATFPLQGLFRSGGGG